MPIDELIQDSTNAVVGAVQGGTAPVVDEVVDRLPKDINWYNNNIDSFNADNKTNLPKVSSEVEISDDDYTAVAKHFDNKVVSDYNKTNEELKLGLPLVTNANEIKAEDAQKIDQAKIITHIGKANKELKMAQDVLGGDLLKFEPFKSVEDIRNRADDFKAKIEKATNQKTSKGQSEVLGKVNNAITKFNTDNGTNIGLFSKYDDAQKAITLDKNGVAPLMKQFDIAISGKSNFKNQLQNELLGGSPIDMPEYKMQMAQKAKVERDAMELERSKKKISDIAILSNKYQKGTANKFLETEFLPFLDQTSIHNSREEADAEVMRLFNANPNLKGAIVKEVNGKFEVFIPEQADATWYKDASQITSEGALKKRSQANALMPEYKALKEEINSYSMQGIAVPPQTLAKYDEVTQTIQDYLTASDILSESAESNYAKFNNLEKERGNPLKAIALEGFKSVNSISKGMINLALSIPELAMLPLPPNVSENTDMVKGLEKLKDKVDEFYGIGTKGVENAMNISSNYDGGALTETAKSVVGITPYMLGGSLALPFMIATGYDANRESLKDNKDLSINEKNLISLVKGTISAIAMSEGLKIVGGHSALNGIAYNVLNKLPANFTKKTLSNLVGKELTQYASNTVASGVGFGALNVLAGTAGHGVDELAKLATDKRFNPQATHDALGDLVNEFKHGLGTGAMLGALTGAMKLGVDKINNEREFATMDAIANKPELVNILKLKLGKQVIDKKISADEYKQAVENIKGVADISIQIPKDYQKSSRYAIFKLLRDNMALEKSKQGLASAFVGRIDEAIKANDAEMVKIADKEDAIKLKSNDTQDTKVTDTEGATTDRPTDLPKTENAVNGDVVEAETNAEVVVSGSALKDVESTAKALESKKEEELNKILPERERLSHRIVKDEYTTTADDMTKGGNLIPNDFYQHPEYYADLSDPNYKESWDAIKKIKGNPDAEITIYRSAPNGSTIEEGDWISLSKKYAKQEGEHPTDESQDLPVISMKVKAKEIVWDGNDINEFAYYPEKSESKADKISKAYHKAKADGSNPELVKAVEDLLGEAPTQYTEAKKAEVGSEEVTPPISESGSPATETATSKAENIELAKRIRDKKIGGVFADPTLIATLGKTIYNGAMEFCASQVEKGTKIGKAIADTIAWVNERMEGKKWDKGLLGRHLNDQFNIAINGKEVTVQVDHTKETRNLVNGFYSGLEETVASTKSNSLPAKQWAEKLSEEAKWTGLTDWLGQQQGSVSKADIQQYLKDNRIQVVEVVKTQKDYRDDWDKENDNPKDLTKFSQYQLEGEKENYKEVLVTMPSRVRFADKWAFYKSKGYSKEAFDVLDDAKKQDLFIEFKAEDKRQRESSVADFKSSHFDEPNILVHLRMNTRTDADGNKVLFLEEVQSDWGQKGKKEGFKDDAKQKQWDELESQRQALWDEVNENHKGQIVPPLLQQKINEVVKKQQALYVGLQTPSAPFVTDTNAWTKLALKFALKEAVKQGADKIAWSTGTQQFDRWGSEKIDWKKTDDGWQVSIQEQVSGEAFNNVNVADKALSDITTVRDKERLRSVIKRTLSRERNDAEIDKLTERIWNRMQTEDSGTSLPRKEGMEEFYGVPADMKRAKNFTIKKEGELFAVKDEKGKTIRTFKQENEANKFKENYGLGIVGNVAKSLFKQEPKTVEIKSATKGGEGDIANYKNGEYQETSTQHSIDITPELKAQVSEGLPLFENLSLADKVRSLKSKKGTLQTDLTGGLKDLVLEEIAQLIEDGVEVYEAIKKALANPKYAKLDKDEITKLILNQNTNENEVFKKTPSEIFDEMAKNENVTWGIFDYNSGASKFSDASPEVFNAIHKTFRSAISRFGIDSEKLRDKTLQEIQEDTDIPTEVKHIYSVLSLLHEIANPSSEGLQRINEAIKKRGSYAIMVSSFDKPFLVGASRDNILINISDKIKRIGAPNDLGDYIKKVSEEELIHLLSNRLSSDKDYEDVYKEMSEDEVKYFKEIYGEGDTKNIGGEYVRMFIQDKIFGLPTEGVVLKLKPTLKKILNDVLVFLRDLVKTQPNAKISELVKRFEDAVNGVEVKRITDSSNTRFEAGKIPLTADDFKIRDSEKAVDRTKRVESELKARGYDKKEIDYILKGGFERIAKVDDLREVKGVVDNLNKIFDEVKKKAKGYISDKDATDKAVERVQHEWVLKGKEIILENAIRKFKKEHGVDVKTPTDTAVKPKPIMITVDERKALIDQIKAIARSTKEVMNNFKDVSKTIHEILKGHNTKISTKQLDAIQRRMGMLKVGSDIAIQKYVEYIENVLADAEYADQIKSIKKYNKGIKKALKNNDIPLSVRDMAMDFLTIDPYEVADAYKHNDIAQQIYNAMKTSGVRVIDGQVKDLTRKAIKLSDINEYIKKEKELHVDEEKLKTEKVDNSDEIKAELQRKYNRLSQMINYMIANNGKSPIDGEEYPFTEIELNQLRDIAKMDLTYFKNAKDWQLTNEALEHVLLNGDMGLIPHILSNYKIEVDAKKGIDTRIEKTKGNVSLLPISNFLSKIEALIKSQFEKGVITDDYSLQKLFNGRYSMRIDDLLKNFKDNKIFETGMEIVAKAYANYKTTMKRLDASIIERKLFTANEYDLDKQLESKFRITMFLRQLEYESNPQDKTQIPAMDYMVETMSASENKDHPIQDRALDMLKRVVAENSEDDQISLAKLSKNMSKAEKDASVSLRDLYDELLKYHDKVAVEIENKPYHGKNNYSHLNASPKSKNEILTASEKREQYARLVGGTKSGTLESRSGSASPINMDPFSTANRAIREVLLDYFMTTPLRTMGKIGKGFVDYTVKELGKYQYGTKEYENALLRRDIATAMKRSFEKLQDDLLQRAFYESTTGAPFMQLMAKRTTQYLLSRVDKLFSELFSNIGFVAMTNPDELALGTTKYHKLVKDDAKLGAILEAVLSHNSERILPHGSIGTSAMDTNDFDIVTTDNQNLIDPAKRTALKYYYKTLARPIKGGEKVAEAMVTQGDLLVIRRLWVGAMDIEFKKLTGKTIDFDKIASQDAEYLYKYKDELREATSKADRIVVNTGASKNMFVVAPDLVGRNANLTHIINYYLRGFNMNEYEMASSAIIHAFKGGKISREQALGQLEGIALRAGIYKVVQVSLSALITAGLSSVYAMFVDDEKDKEGLESMFTKTGLTRDKIAQLQVDIMGKENFVEGSKDVLMTGDEDFLKQAKRNAENPASMIDNFKKGILQQAVSIALTRNFGNLLSGYGIAPAFESINEAIIGDTYDPYKDNLMYSKIPDATKDDWQTKTIEQFLGPFGLSVASVFNTYQLLADRSELKDKIKTFEEEFKSFEKGEAKDKLDKANKELATLNTKMIINSIVSIAFITGSVPSLKNFKDAYDKSVKPKYRLPSDWKRIEKNYNYLKKYKEASAEYLKGPTKNKSVPNIFK